MKVWTPKNVGPPGTTTSKLASPENAQDVQRQQDLLWRFACGLQPALMQDSTQSTRGKTTCRTAPGAFGLGSPCGKKICSILDWVDLDGPGVGKMLTNNCVA